MKLIFSALLCLTFSSFSSRAQAPSYLSLPKDSATQKVMYTAVTPVPAVSQAELFSRGQAWAARTFVDSKAASRVEDKAAGTLIFQTSMASPGPENVYTYTVAIYTKEGRYKYVVDQITRTWGVRNGSQWAAGPVTKPLEYFGTTKLNKGMQEELVRFNAQIKELVKGMEQAMASSPAKGKDW